MSPGWTAGSLERAEQGAGGLSDSTISRPQSLPPPVFPSPDSPETHSCVPFLPRWEGWGSFSGSFLITNYPMKPQGSALLNSAVMAAPAPTVPATSGGKPTLNPALYSEWDRPK